MHARVILGVGKGVLFREMYHFSNRGVPLSNSASMTVYCLTQSVSFFKGVLMEVFHCTATQYIPACLTQSVSGSCQCR